MLALAPQPLQSDRDCPPPISRSSSSSQPSRSRPEPPIRDRDSHRGKSSSASSSSSEPPPAGYQPKVIPVAQPPSFRAPPRTTPPAARSPLLHPHTSLDGLQAEVSKPEIPRVQPTTEGEKAFLHIHNFPAQDLLKLLSSLLQDIASQNDRLRTHSSRASSEEGGVGDSVLLEQLTTASRASMNNSNACLQFHARHIPSISLEAYFMRILKYCPSSNEVFLSLLVYFDRMSKLVTETTGRDFIIDSYNIHRLVIAGVTVASKFFSDVFFTNSRYAKVGGLPQAELNQLELQFLLLNDFNLVVSQCEMQRYAVQLIAYAAGKTPLLPPPISPPHSTAMLPAEEVTPNINGFIQHAEAAQSTTSLASSRTDDTDDEDATVRPPHSCEASETSSLATADSDEEEEGEADDDDSDDTNSDSPSPSLRAPSLVQRISASV